MMAGVVQARLRRAFYLDSVALMRLADTIGRLPGVATASLMIGTESNRRLLEDAGLLAETVREAGPDDLIIAVRAASAAECGSALDVAERLIDQPKSTSSTSSWRPRSLAAAHDALKDANLALISVPGEFAAAEARAALKRGLHVMLFSDNVPIEDEIALKRFARDRALLMMGPDCGTALIAGAPLGFANAIPPGGIGLVAASGTGLQEVACLIARGGGGLSHALGTGGRDLGEAVGGLATLAAIDALDADPATGTIVLVSKPPAPAVARAIMERLGRSPKPAVVCCLGATALTLPPNVRQAQTLRDAAALALGQATPAPLDLPRSKTTGRIAGLFAGGTLCAEAQLILAAAGRAVASNVPVPGARALDAALAEDHRMIDLGADEYTRGRPHPMIEPTVRDAPLGEALADPAIAVVLIDLVLGFGAHPDPAGAITAVLAQRPAGKPVVASVCGTDDDPQSRATQVAHLEAAGVRIAPSNADATALALSLAQA
jgi:FdrA protein